MNIEDKRPELFLSVVQDVEKGCCFQIDERLYIHCGRERGVILATCLNDGSQRRFILGIVCEALPQAKIVVENEE